MQATDKTSTETMKDKQTPKDELLEGVEDLGKVAVIKELVLIGPVIKIISGLWGMLFGKTKDKRSATSRKILD